jgi:hypothetical protein
VDAIEQVVNIARQRADAKRVDQAILARAFRGSCRRHQQKDRRDHQIQQAVTGEAFS